MTSETPPRLSELSRCFQGVIPSVVATSDGRGVPNITYVSQVHFLDDGHVALSCQFFNKTRRNLDENPRVRTEIYDPVTMQAYRLSLRFLRSETSGPLFDTMSVRIQAIASHTGMTGVFRLIAADVFEVLGVERVEVFLSEVVPAENDGLREGLRSELRGLQSISERINQQPRVAPGRHTRPATDQGQSREPSDPAAPAAGREGPRDSDRADHSWPVLIADLVCARSGREVEGA